MSDVCDGLLLEKGAGYESFFENSSQQALSYYQRRKTADECDDGFVDDVEWSRDEELTCQIKKMN
jgi:hypothetical protein